MSRALFDDDNGQHEQTLQSNPAQTIPKNGRKKITLLDDIDELNQRINGPGANQEIIKAQEVLLKTYEFMKADEISEPQAVVKKTNEEIRKESRRKQANTQEKQNVDTINLQKYQKSNTFQEQLRNIKGPRIIVTMKKIDLSKDPNPSDFYLKGLEYIVDENDGTRAPTNSVFENKQQGLFSKALTDRRGLPVSFKAQKISNQSSLRK